MEPRAEAKNPPLSRIDNVMLFGIVGIFLLAFVSKLTSFRSFASSIDLALMTGQSFSTVFAAVVLLIELGSAGALLWRCRSKILLVLTALSGSFLGYSAWKWAMKIPAPCNCFGLLLTLPPWAMVLLNLCLLVALTRLRLVTDLASRKIKP